METPAYEAFPGASAAETNTVNLMAENTAVNPVTGTAASPTAATDPTKLTYDAATNNYVGDTRSFTEKLMDGDIGEAFSPTSYTAKDVFDSQGVNALTATEAQWAAAEKLAALASPGLLASYGPMAAAGTLVAAGSGMFDVPEQEPAVGEEYFDETGFDYLQQNPEEYYVSEIDPVTQRPVGLDPRNASNRDFLVESNRYDPFNNADFIAANQDTFNVLMGGAPQAGIGTGPQMYAADGGQVFPRRTGGIMPNEGIPNQDSVRAALMPGEFVFTKDAVRGMGKGSLNEGIKNMYSVMRGLEAKGRRYA